MERTLLLSQSYEPLTVIGWKKAICLLTLGKCEIVEEYDREIRSISLVIKMPAVVRLITRFRRGKKDQVRFSRQNVLARDRWSCQYCGVKKSIADLNWDHVVPRSQGGKTCWENIVTSCIDCNTKKANRTPEQAGMHLRRLPEKPSWVPFFSIVLSNKSTPEQWASYLYWNSELDKA